MIRGLLPARFHLVNRLEVSITKSANSRVISGPFEGMKYVDKSVGSRLSPKLLGTYEIELCDVIDEIITGQPDVICVIGAAEGYYTVGFARALPETQLVAWEVSKLGRSLSRMLATLNSVGDRNIDLRGLCSVSDLSRRLQDFDPQDDITLVVDVEGGEALLLDPEIIPRLNLCDLLVEVHECFIPGVREILRSRFSKTHQIEEIWAKKRSLADWPEQIKSHTSNLWNGAKIALMDERRPEGMSWLYLSRP